MSAPELQSKPEDAAGMQLETCETDIVEIVALRHRTRDLQSIALSRGLQLPPLGRVAIAPDQLSLCVRPDRWLLLTPPGSPGATAGAWQTACAGAGAAIDLSSGLTALQLAGRAARELLVRACRLDLDPDAFPVGAAAATIMVQVSVTLAVLPSGLLLLTPSSTARHLRDWLTCAAKPFGLMPPSDPTIAARLPDPRS